MLYYAYMKKYTNIALPEELVVEIKKAIEKSNLGYKSKSEFVKEAIRNSLNSFFTQSGNVLVMKQKAKANS